MPSLRNLQVFEAAARHENFRKAADALFLTHGAVGRQVKSLEDELGTDLFARIGKRVTLTEQGRFLQAAVAEALRLISDATVDVRQGICADPDHLQVTMPPSFAYRWLTARMDAFRHTYPDTQVELIPTVSLLDLSVKDVSLAVRMGKGNWEGMTSELLVREWLLPVASAGGIKGHDTLPANTADLLRFPLLNPYDDWERWFRKAGLPMRSAIKGKTCESVSSLLQAAEAGEGIALAHHWLVVDSIREGKLVRLPGPAISARRDYYVVRPSGYSMPRAARSFVSWLHESVNETLTQHVLE